MTRDGALEHAMVVAARAMEPREHLIWAERGRGRQASSRVIQVLFGLAYAGFAVVWIGLASGLATTGQLPESPGELLFSAFGLPFVVIGLVMVFRGAFGETGPEPVFALSDRRALVLLPRKPVRAIRLSDVRDVTIQEASDGSGGVLFKAEGHPSSLRFNGIPRVNAVADDIARARSRARETNG